MQKFWSENWWKISLLLIIFLLLTIFYTKIELYFAGHQGMATIWGYILNTIVIASVMYFIDFQNKKRWQKDSLQRSKNDAMIETIGKLANCLNFIKARNLQTLNDSISISYNHENFDKPFREACNSLSKLSVFYNDESVFSKKIKKVIGECEICVHIFGIFKHIQDHQDAWDEIKKEEHHIVSQNSVIRLNIIKYIQFINNKPSKIWTVGDYSYQFHKEFHRDYNDNFIQLISKLFNASDEIYKKLGKECELEKI